MYTYVVYSAWVDDYDDENQGDPTIRRVSHWLLLLLALLMTFWLGLIVKVAMFQQRNHGNVDDFREDKVQQTTNFCWTRRRFRSDSWISTHDPHYLVWAKWPLVVCCLIHEKLRYVAEVFP